MSFEVTILGCGSATPTSTQHPTAQLLQMAERFFLIDCGEGTQQQLRKFNLRMGKINHIFISHMHGDHFFGLIGLLSSFHLLNRTNTLHIYAPPALQEVIEVQLKASTTTLIYPLVFHATQANEKRLLFEDKRVEVYSFPLRHSTATTGFIFCEKQRERNIIAEKITEFLIPHYEIRKIKKGADFILPDGTVVKNEQLTLDPPNALSYAFCSDTVFREKTAEYVQGVDVLYHESTFLEEHKKRAKQTKHSTAAQAAKVAALAKAKLLLLGHFSARYKNKKLFEEEALDFFKNVIVTKEGMRIIAAPDEIITEF